ncbi:unnamed protein product [Durusdinium trenchii]|uniref:Uncharacterized protein n=2 Tax=Durusdinium trenchii TaxID=1381693 RepID=A0ABP0JSE9_9DINO
MWLTVPLQLIMPTLGTWITLQIVSGAIAGIPLAEEFVSVAVPGTFVILCCGPCLFIPAVLMGDWMAEAREEREDPWIPSWMLPKELVWQPLSKEQRRLRRRYALFAILSYSHRAACPMLLLLVFVLLVVTLSNNIQAPLDAGTPQLFGDGELFREGQVAKELWGALPSPETIAARALRNATACRIEAAMSGASGASSACSWFSCEAEKGVELAEDTCSCDYRLFTPQSGASTCQAEARFSGLHAVPETFWPWVQEQYTMEFLSNASSQQEPPLGIEDWNLGQNLLQSQVSSSRVAQRPVNGNTGCFRAQCYCDARRCKRPSGWQRFGSFTVPGSVGQSSNVSMDTAVPSTDVFIVWGLEQQTSNDASASGLTFQAALNWADPQVQREQLRTCEATPPEMEVLSRKCFASDFKTWLESKGERYPVKPSELYAERLQEFAEEHGREKYFWRAPTGGLAGTVARLRVPRDTPRQQLQEGWQHYMSLRRMAPWRSQAWTALEAITEEEELQLLQAATNEVALLLVMMLALWTCLFTFSLRMALAGACAGGFGILMFFLCQPFGPQSAALQLLCLLLLVTTLVAPASRFLFFYSGARNGPSKRVKNEKSTSFEIEEDAAQEPKEVRQVRGDQTQRFVSLAAEDPQLQKEKEEQQRRAQVAAERKEMQSLFRPSAIPSERRNRSTTALGNSLEILLGNVLAMIISWVTLWVFAPDSLAQVGRIFPVLSVTLLMVILCVLPVLILFGLGSSRVWRQAMLAFMGAITGWNRRFGGPACSFPELRKPEDDDLEVSRSIKVLGWPFTRIASYWRAHQVTASRK